MAFSSDSRLNIIHEKYRPKVIHSKTDISISGGATATLVHETFEGNLDELLLRVQDHDMSVILEIDGIEVYNLKLRDLNNDYQLIMSDDSGENRSLIRIAVSSNGKQFFDKYTCAADFTSIKVKVKNNDGSTRKVYAYMVRTREKV